MDEDVRERFHELSNHVHRVESRVLVAEGQIKVLERAMEKAATSAEVQSLRSSMDQQIKSLSENLDLKLELVLRDIKAVVNDFAPVKRAVYGLVALILVAFVGALASGVFK
jgi:predicted  nucleic acid-binding Zn-ribbon protein